jgi:hypothetical protein
MSESNNREISRRCLLEKTGYGLAAGLVGPLVLGASSAAGASDQQRFMDVSKTLTGKPQLDTVIGQRLFQLLETQPGFIAGLNTLSPLPKGDPANWSKAQQETASAVLSAWYLGKVGAGLDAAVVSYEKALMFDAVAGALVIRSYCSGKPGYWAAEPTVTA